MLKLLGEKRTETVPFTIGSDASCTDGACGKVSRVVLDPVSKVLTHLVVEPEHGSGIGKLVPLDLVDGSTGEARLSCTLAQFEKLEVAEYTHFLPGSVGYAGYDPGHVVAWPYYGMGVGIGGHIGEGAGNMSQPVTSEVVPEGEVTVRRGDHVHATDGGIGRVQGLVIDPRDHRVTHVLLQEGHLWGRKEVAIPIGMVTGVEEGIALSITKDEVQELPSVDIDHWDR